MRQILLALLLCSSCMAQQSRIKPSLGVGVNWSDSLSSGLIASWLMNEGAGNTVNDVTGNNLTMTSSASWSGGRFGCCLQLDGTDDTIARTVADWRSQDSVGTIAAWIQWGGENAAGTSQGILSSCDTASATRLLYFLMYRVDATHIYLAIFQRNNDTADLVRGGTNFNGNGNWHHVAVTSTDSTYVLYVDGIAESLTIASGSNTGDWFADTANRDNITIGDRVDSTDHRYFEGRICNLHIWSRPLSGMEIGQFYRDPFGMFYDDPVALVETGIPVATGASQVILISSVSPVVALIIGLSMLLSWFGRKGRT